MGQKGREVNRLGAFGGVDATSRAASRSPSRALPLISNMPAGMRAQREAGFLSHRVMACIRPGILRRSPLRRRSGSA
jgi:hypothetical protein